MALSDILDKISKTASDEIEKLKKTFEEDKKNLEAAEKEKQKSIDEDLHEKIEEKSKKIFEKAETLADMEAKTQLLDAKRNLINEILEEVVEELAGSGDYESIVAEMLKRIDIAENNVVIVPAKGKEEQTKAAIKKSGKDYFISDKSANIKGGFVLKTEKIEIDNSFETIVKKQLRDDLEISLNKTLF